MIFVLLLYATMEGQAIIGSKFQSKKGHSYGRLKHAAEEKETHLPHKPANQIFFFAAKCHRVQYFMHDLCLRNNPKTQKNQNLTNSKEKKKHKFSKNDIKKMIFFALISQVDIPSLYLFILKNARFSTNFDKLSSKVNVDWKAIYNKI